MTNLNPSKEAPMTTSSATTSTTSTDLRATALANYGEFQVDATSAEGLAFFAARIGRGAVGCRVSAAGFAQMVAVALELGLVVRMA